jgi:hypothetical protein
MQISFELGPEFNRTVSELGAMGDALLAAAQTGLEAGGKLAAGTVVRDYLSGQALKRRSGLLSKAVDSWSAAPLDIVVGVPEGSSAGKYAYLLGDETKHIAPHAGKYLAIPIGEGLTASGVARYSSPRQVPDGFFVRTGGRLLFGYKNGKKGKFRALFVLVTSVMVQGTGVLYDGVLDSVDDISESIETEIGKIKDVE